MSTLRFLGPIFVWVMGCGFFSCGAGTAVTPESQYFIGSQGFGGMEKLDQPLNSLSTPCGFVESSGIASVAVADDENAIIYKRSVDNAILVNGDVCGTASTRNLKKLVVRGTAGANTVTLDLISGLLGTGSRTSVGVDIDLLGGTDSFYIRGSNSADTITLGSDGISINTDANKDVTLANTEIIVVSTGGGNDTVSGGGGYGTGNAFPSSFTVFGGSGDDKLTGGSGDDTLHGDEGKDTLNGGLGADVFNGGDDTDTVSYASRTTAITATIAGGSVSGALNENDSIGSDCETLTGGSGDDILEGDDNANTLNGGAGNDTLRGNGGADILNGEAGNDTFDEGTASNGGDIFNGGAGTDTVDYGGRNQALTITMDGVAFNDGQAGEGDNVKADVENIVCGSGNDSVTGNGYNNELTGGDGNDTLNGGAGADVFLEGSASNGGDSFVGGTGLDRIDYSLRTAALTVTMGDALANDGESGENDNVGSDVENLDVGTGATNTVTGNALDNAINGNSGDDTLNGAAGNDILFGAAGADTLNGNAGEDYLDGGEDSDTLDGGDGSGDICWGESTLNCEL